MSERSERSMDTAEPSLVPERSGGMSETVDDIATNTQPLSSPMTIGVEAYLSPEYVKDERDKLWRKVWQQVGRVEEIPRPGDFLTYEILDDSIIIVRTADDKIRAYHNVCAHRGRKLVDTPPGERNAKGRKKQFVCGFHGWRYDLEGRNTFVPEREDWPCGLTERNDGLVDVHVDTWGGWIWINLDPNPSETLAEYLDPAASCSIRSSCRTCATAGGGGWCSTATGRSRWRPSWRPTTCPTPIRSS